MRVLRADLTSVCIGGCLSTLTKVSWFKGELFWDWIGMISNTLVRCAIWLYDVDNLTNLYWMIEKCRLSYADWFAPQLLCALRDCQKTLTTVYFPCASCIVLDSMVMRLERYANYFQMWTRSFQKVTFALSNGSRMSCYEKSSQQIFFYQQL